ncbi:MAG: methyl-accepting chemotaxis protein [Methanospirillum sp.]|uniref:methyl-accepting chemotaxis protein n=1 Tax=Methanospirillum sp. TaxID=45200 RepID=UPI00236A9B01|nr:methyl-accepting chemotaxis protein [Methanospirillum sp.]MDD1727976.1 methyl-accepting chemotaxis protein [Methanospirillum sp.]
MSEDLEKIQRLANALFQQSPYPTILWSPDLHVEDVNKPLLDLTGYDRTHTLSMRVQDFMVISSSGGGFEDVKRTRRSIQGEAVFHFPSGNKTVERHVIPLLDKNGEIEKFLAIYRDMTSERENLQLIQENQVKTEKIWRYIEHEIQELARAYQKIGDERNLTIRYELSSPDEYTQKIYEQLGIFQNAVRHIIKNLQENIGDVNTGMQKLISASSETGTSVQDASKAIAQIANNLGSVSQHADKSSNGVEQISRVMQDMSAAVEEITSSMGTISTLSQETNNLSNKGVKLAEQAEQSMSDISLSTDKVFGIVTDVEAQMVKISKIVVLIREIANQTNLLALNAAIEAARAGEAGRGFAVVAAEVKSLAQESKNSAEQIEGMINTLKTSTQNASTAMEDTKKTVQLGEKVVGETVKTFASIASSIEEITKSASEVAAATQEQAATTEEITASVTDIANLVQETAKEACDAASASEESAAAMDEIHKMAQMVNDVALEVMDANKKYKIN